jgi:hypothetical protein
VSHKLEIELANGHRYRVQNHAISEIRGKLRAEGIELPEEEW